MKKGNRNSIKKIRFSVKDRAQATSSITLQDISLIYVEQSLKKLQNWLCTCYTFKPTHLFSVQAQFEKCLQVSVGEPSCALLEIYLAVNCVLSSNAVNKVPGVDTVF